jgi:hypothetical protein
MHAAFLENTGRVLEPEYLQKTINDGPGRRLIVSFRYSIQTLYQYHVGNIDVAMAAQSRWFGMRQISIVNVWGKGKDNRD